MRLRVGGGQLREGRMLRHNEMGLREYRSVVKVIMITLMQLYKL